MRFGDGANHSFDLFTDFVFISKNDIQLPIMYKTKTKKFDIITPENRCYRWLLNSIFRDVVYQQKKSIYTFCYNYKKIIDENMDCDRRSEEHTSELQSPANLVCRLLLEKKTTHPQQS